MIRPQHPRAGFTLIEILVVVAVLAILAAGLTPAVIGYTERTRVRSAVESFRAIQLALTQYRDDVGSLAPLREIGELSTDRDGRAHAHFVAGDGQSGWDGPYLEPVAARAAGGRFAITVRADDQAIVTLGDRHALGPAYDETLRAVDRALDGDGDLERGVVWGDERGIRLGVNTFRQ